MYKENSRQIKVKVYYTFRGDSATRLATFPATTDTDVEDNHVPVSLRECLMAVCSSSPDIICHDHDLSIYTANFREACHTLAEQSKGALVWEGHGLLSWVMESASDIIVHGRSTSTNDVEIYLELQPTLKWAKDQFYSALKSQNFDFKHTQTSSCSCIQALPSGTRKGAPIEPLRPQLPRLPPPPGMCRPEPIFPSNDATFNRPLLTPPPLYEFNLANTPERRSAFTPTAPPEEHSTSIIYTPSNKKRRKTSVGTVERPQSSIQQVSTMVRTYYEVDRDENGNYILPIEIDSWTVVNLGTVIWDRSAYHNQRYIYPVNYTVRKWYRSMVDPKSDTQYTCRILDNGREPKFEVTADDCPMTYSGPTPTTVWTIIVRRAFAIRNQEYGHNPVGPDFFGLRKNTISKMIQDLPNAEKCTQYVWQTFEPAKFNKPGRNRRRIDPMLPGSLFGGVNYSLTSSRALPPPRKEASPTNSLSPPSPPSPALHTPTIKTA